MDDMTPQLHTASDGSRWDAASQRDTHDTSLTLRRASGLPTPFAGTAEDLLAMLPPCPQDSDFSNGGGHLRHDPDTLAVVTAGFIDVACRTWPGHADQLRAGSAEHAVGLAMRLDDASTFARPITRVIARLSNTDLSTAREYGQPYFRDHPHLAQERCWNAEATCS